MIFQKIGDILGLSPRQAQLFTLCFGVVVAIALYISVESGFSFYNRYSSGGAVVAEPTATPAEELLRRSELPTWVKVGRIIPGGPQNDLGQLVVCSARLVGDEVSRYGWVWDPSADGCRRLRIE